MSNDTLEIKASLVVAKPAEEVYEAIVNPAKMTNFFISKRSGRMEEGRKNHYLAFPGNGS